MFALTFRFVVGGQVFKEILRHRGQLFRFMVFVSAQTLMSVIYPAYQVLFLAAAKSGYELYVVALLPIVKMFMKNVIALSFTRMHDMMPESVIFSVDFFNAFYIATSMQSASSITTVVVIMASDLLNSAIAMNFAQKSISSIINRLPSDRQSPFDLLEVACSLCRQPDEFENQERAKIQLRSCIPYQISSSGRDLLDSLSKFQGYRSHTRSFSHRLLTPANPNVKFTKTSQWCCTQRRSSSIQPLVMKRVVLIKRSNTSISVENFRAPSQTQQSELLRDSLKILFTAECHVLSEYLESVVPILYATYIMVMVHLPSARYHSEMTGLTRDNVNDKVKAVFAYAVLEFLSFVVMAVIMHRNCGMKVLYHLAFVLETHMPLVQDKLITWTLLTLASRVVHFGVDFTFHFAWV
ncbi:hypothetical protein V7S43_007154 [Phytophthora oleae]|uniref:ABC transmembrane type-1 domain-containing protein n=1 Tax=Phytophthora oleae TaxID=2107226 RepID=A0ABD3FPN9_9STRA